MWTEGVSNQPVDDHLNSLKAHRNLSVPEAAKSFVRMLKRHSRCFQCTGNRPGVQTLQKTDASPHTPQNPIPIIKVPPPHIRAFGLEDEIITELNVHYGSGRKMRIGGEEPKIQCFAPHWPEPA